MTVVIVEVPVVEREYRRAAYQLSSAMDRKGIFENRDIEVQRIEEKPPLRGKRKPIGNGAQRHSSDVAVAISGGSPRARGVALGHFRTNLTWRGWWFERYKPLPTLHLPFDEHPFKGPFWARNALTLTSSASIQHALVPSLTPSRLTCLDRERQPTNASVGMDTIVSGIGAGTYDIRFDYEREYTRKGPASPGGLKSLFFQKQSRRWRLLRTLFTG